MISTAFVGLCLTSFPKVLSISRRPLRPDVPLAAYFPAWVDSAYDSACFDLDEPTKAVEVAEIVSPVCVSEDPTIETPDISVGCRLPFAVGDTEEMNGLSSNADELLSYHSGPEVPEVSAPAPFEDATVSTSSGEDCVTLETKVTVLRPEAPEFRLPVRAPEVVPITSGLRPEAPSFVLLPKPAGISAPLNKNAVEFKPRRALAPSRGSSDTTISGEASRIQFVTPQYAVCLETPRLNKDAPVFFPRAMARPVA